LHFAEVARYFATLNIPRGAYAARAMGEKRWLALTETQRAILEEGVAVWERALESQLLAAEFAGDAVGREHGLVYTTPPPGDVTRFLESYDLFAERGAESLRRFEIDGLPTYRYARALVEAHTRHGRLDCHGDGT
jgi:hypothetical protein